MSAHSLRSTIGRSPLRLLIAIGIAAMLGVGAYAFTASNTVSNSSAGSGVGTVSGYAVSNIHYVLNTTTPANIDSLTFTIAPVVPNGGSGKVIVQAGLTTGGPNTYSCTSTSAGDTITCATTTPVLPTVQLTGLTVIAAQ